MPIYEYLCEDCGRVSELMQKMSDPPPRSCPECGSRKIAKLVSRTAFQLKGGGWYADLYASTTKETKGRDDAKGEAKGGDDGKARDGGTEAAGKRDPATAPTGAAAAEKPATVTPKPARPARPAKRSPRRSRS